jgi:hypothetical protein
MASGEPSSFQDALAAALPSVYPTLSAKDTVIKALSPRIAVTSSREVDLLCQKNNLPRFVDLIAPFGDAVDGKGIQIVKETCG